MRGRGDGEKGEMGGREEKKVRKGDRGREGDMGKRGREEMKKRKRGDLKENSE